MSQAELLILEAMKRSPPPWLCEMFDDDGGNAVAGYLLYWLEVIWRDD